MRVQPIITILLSFCLATSPELNIAAESCSSQMPHSGYSIPSVITDQAFVSPLIYPFRSYLGRSRYQALKFQVIKDRSLPQFENQVDLVLGISLAASMLTASAALVLHAAAHPYILTGSIVSAVSLLVGMLLSPEEKPSNRLSGHEYSDTVRLIRYLANDRPELTAKELLALALRADPQRRPLFFRTIAKMLELTLNHPLESVMKLAGQLLIALAKHGAATIIEHDANGPGTALESVFRKVLRNALSQINNVERFLHDYLRIWRMPNEAPTEFVSTTPVEDKASLTSRRLTFCRAVVAQIIKNAKAAGLAHLLVHTVSAQINALPFEAASNESREYLEAVARDIESTEENSVDPNKEEDRVETLTRLLKSQGYPIDQLALNVLQKILENHGLLLLNQVDKLMGKLMITVTTKKFLLQIAQIDNDSTGAAELRALAEKSGALEELLTRGDNPYPWNALSFHTQLSLVEASGKTRVALLEKNALWTPSNLVSFLQSLAELEPENIVEEESVRPWAEKADEIQTVLIQYRFPWHKLGLKAQIALATTRWPDRRTHIITFWTPSTEKAVDFWADIKKMEPDLVEQTIPDPAHIVNLEVAAEHKNALKIGGRAWWERGGASATIHAIQFYGGESPEFRLMIRFPAAKKDRARILPFNLADLRSKGVSEAQLTKTVRTFLINQGYGQMPSELLKRYPFLGQDSLIAVSTVQLKKTSKTISGNSARKNKKYTSEALPKMSPAQKRVHDLRLRLEALDEQGIKNKQWKVIMDLQATGWSEATIGFILPPKKGRDGDVSPTITYTQLANGAFIRSIFHPAGVRGISWPEPITRILPDLDREMKIGPKQIRFATEWGSINHFDPSLAAAAWQMKKLRADMGNDALAARRAFAEAVKDIERLGFPRDDLSATIRQLKLATPSQALDMQRKPRRGFASIALLVSMALAFVPIAFNRRILGFTNLQLAGHRDRILLHRKAV